jgi:putative ATP-dependent helicase yeeB
MDHMDRCNTILEKIAEQPVFDVNDVREWLNSGDRIASDCIKWLIDHNQIELCEDESGDAKYISKEAAINNDSKAERPSKQTINVVNVGYNQTGHSTHTNELGMREMQQRAYEKRTSQRLLIKAPPASGKSRALMFLALDKLHNQGVKKVIIAVPERSIGASFRDEDLTKYGYYWDWRIAQYNNLCNDDGLDDKSKVGAFMKFMDSDDDILLCTHATLRFACEYIPVEKFQDCLLAIDEFHHASTSENSVLGSVLHNIMQETNAHIIAMTGTYFRGDSVAILTPEDEATFDKVTYTYYEQLNGYTYLRTLGIGYHFYTGHYLDDGALAEVLDTHKKTIIHIPNVQSNAAGNINKHQQVDEIYSVIGEWKRKDKDTCIDFIETEDGRMLKVANLVEDDPRHREPLRKYISDVARNNIDGLDIIVALGMAKEGFDWPFCEHALTIGYRGSFTEVVQIIGRCTRDSYNKTHAQFTNLIVKPAGTQSDVTIAVNNMLKAITVSLLMEQVLAPEFKFTPTPREPREAKPGEIFIKGLKVPKSERGKQILQTDLEDLVAKTLQDERIERAGANNIAGPYLRQVQTDIIRKNYPGLEDDDIEAIRQNVAVKMAMTTAKIVSEKDDRIGQNNQFVILANRFVKIDELDMNLIDSVNPFHHAFEILSKKMDGQTFKLIQDVIKSDNVNFTDDDALALVPKIQEFVDEHGGKYPSPHSNDSNERLLASAQAYLTRRIYENSKLNPENP